MSGVEIALAAAMAGMAALSSVSADMSQNRQLENSAKVAEYNKSVSEKNAGMAASAGQAEADDARRDSKRRLAEMRAAFGSNGIDLSGSPLDVLSDSATEGALTVARKEYAGEVIATGHRNKAKMSQYEANVYRSSKKSGGSIAVDALFNAGVSAGTSAIGSSLFSGSSSATIGTTGGYDASSGITWNSGRIGVT